MYVYPYYCETCRIFSRFWYCARPFYGSLKPAKFGRFGPYGRKCTVSIALSVLCALVSTFSFFSEKRPQRTKNRQCCRDSTFSPQPGFCTWGNFRVEINPEMVKNYPKKNGQKLEDPLLRSRHQSHDLRRGVFDISERSGKVVQTCQIW